MSNNRPIGFLDSGVGGLTVVKEAMKQLPNETVYYIGDTLRCPYGPRPVEQIKQFTWEMTQFLMKKNVKMIVIACNTATAIALEEIKKTLRIPVVGVINPGARAALKLTHNNKIGVIGTAGTINSGEYGSAIHKKSPKSDVYGIACPKFVPIVESKQYSSTIAESVVSEALAPFNGKNIDTLVMGCTHYPLLKPLIRQEMGEKVKLIDSGAEAVSEVSMLLDYYDIAADATEEEKQHEFFMTGSKKMFEDISHDWLNLESISTNRITLP
ncbi:glutamate racemase [Vagococcus hydrophili]|uniref:Glutamate racemase n=1 Tax=Vagococcus hydrophili TaxID=2714947 RepID=A0A6G8AX49_9ENTE|nr:glutamate racemase [Vagococcus hydrophili]QIL49463.1 glutamate racemase [Vagococcus hydrophili]